MAGDLNLIQELVQALEVESLVVFGWLVVTLVAEPIQWSSVEYCIEVLHMWILGDSGVYRLVPAGKDLGVSLELVVVGPVALLSAELVGVVDDA